MIFSIKGGLALMCNSESIASPSESDTIADSWCLENPVADESDMNRCVCGVRKVEEELNVRRKFKKKKMCK